MPEHLLINIDCFSIIKARGLSSDLQVTPTYVHSKRHVVTARNWVKGTIRGEHRNYQTPR